MRRRRRDLETVVYALVVPTAMALYVLIVWLSQR